jgi:hypothetical protein
MVVERFSGRLPALATYPDVTGRANAICGRYNIVHNKCTPVRISQSAYNRRHSPVHGWFEVPGG